MAFYEECIGIENSNFNECLEVYKTADIGNSSMYSFFLRNKAEVIEKKLAWSFQKWNDAHAEAIFVKLNGIVIGHIVYKYFAKTKNLFIVLSAVDPNFRGHGIYKILHKYYEQHAINLGCNCLSSYVHVKNSSRLSSARKVNFNPEFYMMVKRISY